MSASRSIIFSAPIIRAIRAGLKTQTRRIIKPQPKLRRGFELDIPGPLSTRAIPVCWDFKKHGVKNDSPYSQLWLTDKAIPFPYGKEGDRIWVRESWRPTIAHHCATNTCDCDDVNVTYAADGAIKYFDSDEIPNEWTMPKAAKRGNVTPMFMPRWASRIELEITGRRVERLNGISEEDAKAEGFDDRYLSLAGGKTVFGNKSGVGVVEQFRRVWDSLNAKKSPWASNPWVWVVGFRPIKGGDK